MDRDHEALIMNYLDGTLAAADQRRLQELMETDGEFQAEFLKYARQERVLRALLEKDEDNVLSEQIINQLRAEENGDEFVDQLKKEITGRKLRPAGAVRSSSSKKIRAIKSARISRASRSRRSSAQNAWLLPAGIAAMVALGLIIYFASNQQKPSAVPSAEVIASIATASGKDVVAEGPTGKRALQAGSSLTADDEIRTGSDGQLRLKYPDGTWLDLNSSSTLALIQKNAKDAKQLRLDGGSLTADVKPQPDGEPMSVLTRQARATVRGTVLTMKALASDTRLEVQHGKVELQRLADKATVMVSDGFFAVAGSDSSVALSAQSLTPAVPEVALHEPTEADFLKREYQPKNGAKVLYRLFIPARYDKNQKYPLIVFLHGLFEKGTDNTAPLKNSANGAMTFVSAKNQAKYPCFMMVPQSTSGTWSESIAQVAEAVNALSKEYSLDADRFYVTGLSFGGTGVWDIVEHQPDLFAAAVPICGAGDPNRVAQIKDLAVWAFHSADDPTMKVDGTRVMINELRKAAGRPFYSEFTNGGHGIWTRVFNDPNVLDWMMLQRKGNPVTPPANVPDPH